MNHEKFSSWNFGAFFLPYFWSINNKVAIGYITWISFLWLAIIPCYLTFFDRLTTHHIINDIEKVIASNLYDLSAYPKFPLTIDISMRIILGLTGDRLAQRSNIKKNLVDFRKNQQIWKNFGFLIGMPMMSLLYLSPIYFLGTWL